MYTSIHNRVIILTADDIDGKLFSDLVGWSVLAHSVVYYDIDESYQ